jgi:hypothetical protein
MSTPQNLLDLCRQELTETDMQFIGQISGLPAGVWSRFQNENSFLTAMKVHLYTWEKVNERIYTALCSSTLCKNGIAVKYFPERAPAASAAYRPVSNTPAPASYTPVPTTIAPAVSMCAPGSESEPEPEKKKKKFTEDEILENCVKYACELTPDDTQILCTAAKIPGGQAWKITHSQYCGWNLVEALKNMHSDRMKIVHILYDNSTFKPELRVAAEKHLKPML